MLKLALRSYSALGNTRTPTNSQKYLYTFQLFTDASKITNFWSQQHNLFIYIPLASMQHLCDVALFHWLVQNGDADSVLPRKCLMVTRPFPHHCIWLSEEE